MADAETTNLIISVLSIVIAVVSLINSMVIGQKSNRISNETAKLVSEQEMIKRSLKYEVVHRLISIYKSVSDFNSYLWQVGTEKHAISSEIVVEFYMKKFTELDDLRSTSSYFDYLKVIKNFKSEQKFTQEEIIEIFKSTDILEPYFKTCGMENSIGNIEYLTNTYINEIFIKYERHLWVSILDVAQNLNYKWSLDDRTIELDDETALKERLKAEQKEMSHILRRTLVITDMINSYLVLLDSYEQDLTKYIDEQYKSPDIH